jgi:hypothetical protein
MNNFIKKCFLMIFACLAVGTAKAQIGYDYAQFDLGIGGDINKVYGDAQTLTSTKSLHLNFNYNVSPYVNYVVEVQTGGLQGGDSLTTSTGRQFTNNFTSVILRGQLQMGEIIDYSESSFNNVLKNFYISTGIGMVVNHLTTVNRSSILTPGFYTSGDDYSTELLIPARIGYEFKVFNSYGQPGFKIDLGYQCNFVLGDGLDGYTVGNQKDKYSQYSIGIKFAIGSIASYKKRIPF